MLDAVVKSKLLYGLDTAMLSDAALRKINGFQLKGLRKILKLKTTFVERTNTNAFVYQTARSHTDGEDGRECPKPFSQSYKEARTQRVARLLEKSPSDPERYATLDEASIWNFPSKRLGRPKDKWAAHGLRDLWNRIKTKQPQIPNAHLEINTAKTGVDSNKLIIQTLLELEEHTPGELARAARE